MYLKERLLIYAIVIISGITGFFFTYNHDHYDNFVFFLSGAILITFLLSGYIILFGEGIDNLINEDKQSGSSRLNTLKKVIIGVHPRSRIFIISILIVILVISYWNIVPDYKNAKLELLVDARQMTFESGSGYFLLVTATLINNGSRPVWVTTPTFYESIKIKMEDANGQVIIMYPYNRISGTIPRVKLDSGESIQVYPIQFNYVDDERYQLLENLSITYDSNLNQLLYLDYWTYNTNPPYKITVTYNSFVQQYKPETVWVGTIETTIPNFNIPES